MSDGSVRNNGWIYTGSFDSFILAPEKLDRTALEYDEKEIEGRECNDSYEGTIYNPLVNLLGTNANKKYSNREAYEDCGYCIKELAEPPVIQSHREFIQGNICQMPPGAILYSHEPTCTVSSEKD